MTIPAASFWSFSKLLDCSTVHPSQTILEYSRSGRTYEIYIWFNALLEKSYFSFLIIPITKTCLYNVDPLKPHFYIVKLGFIGVYIIFRISAQKHRLWYSLERPRWGSYNEYPQSMFLSRNKKNIRFFYLKIFSFWQWSFLYIWIGMFS